MDLTQYESLRAYAKMLNTLDADVLEPWLAEDFVYESQTVFSALESKQAYLDYIRPKMQTIKNEGAAVFAEMGEIDVYGALQPCVVLAQHSPDNLVSFILARVEGGKLVRLDLCVAPPPTWAQRSGEYPA